MYVRRSALNFGCYVSHFLSADNKRQLLTPEGFAYGFIILPVAAEFLHKTTSHFSSSHERLISWDDSSLMIKRPKNFNFVIALIDCLGKRLHEAETFI